MLTAEEMAKLYEETIADCKTYSEISTKLKSMRMDETVDSLRRLLCNDLLYYISAGYIKYSDMKFEKNKLIELLCENTKLLQRDNSYYSAVCEYFKHNNKKCIKFIEETFAKDYETLKDQISSPEEFFNEYLLIDMYFEPFKEAYNGFWSDLRKVIEKYPCQEGIIDLCSVIDAYYTCKTDNDALEVLLEAVQKYPDFILLKELTAYTYYSLKMWNNAAAYFESIEDSAIFFRDYDLYFMMGWTYGKLKRFKEEERYYRKSLEVTPDFVNTINNLGYCLYRQKKYQEAIEQFKRCLEIDPQYTYAANNYVRSLIAQGKNRDAKEFVKAGKYKISKDVIKRIEKLDNRNSVKVIKEESADSFEEEILQENSIDLGMKRQQFSNEKLLEDELTARIEAGIEVFGMKLKMYKRKGVYGRQFIIPIGRLDLLCEDDEGNLYVIELKKDSGYDDAYKQTAQYLDWFENSEIAKGKKVYGIICLNSPTKQLIEQVHNDRRMKLFEYQISYTEI